MLGTTEILVIAIVGIIVVDPRKLPDLMKGLGKALAEFKQMSSDVQDSFRREAERADFEKRKAEAEAQLFKEGEAQTQPATETQPQPAAEPEPQPHQDEAPAQPPVERDPDLANRMPEPEPVAVAHAEAPAETPAQSLEPSFVEPAPSPAPQAAQQAPQPEDEPAVEESAPAPAIAQESAPAVAEEAQAPAVADEPQAPAEAAPPPPPPPPPTGDDAVGEGASGRMTLIGHLQDLRKGLTRSLYAVVAGFFICYAFAGQMLKILMQPMLTALKQSHFIYTIPTEAFFAEMWIAFIAGMFLCSPYIFYQIWSFVAPGLYSHEKRWIIPIALCSALFFVSGALFGYFVVFPFGFEFFASYASDILMFTPKLDEYLGFALKLLFAFGIVFELPLFIFFLARLGIVSHEGLRAKRKYAVLGAFIVAAALTPPDALSQTMMAVPLVVLYEVGIWGAYFFGKKKPKPEQAAEA